jgi:hypothetical protein
MDGLRLRLPPFPATEIILIDGDSMTHAEGLGLDVLGEHKAGMPAPQMASACGAVLRRHREDSCYTGEFLRVVGRG